MKELIREEKERQARFAKISAQANKFNEEINYRADAYRLFKNSGLE